MPSEARARAGPRLLVVEDEALVAMLIEDALRDLGCVVVGPVGNVAQALAVLESETIEGAMLDVNLGGTERSYPIADALRARGVPFIFVTGYGEEGVDQAYAPVGVLQKPFDPRTLERFVAAMLAERRGPRASRARRRR